MYFTTFLHNPLRLLQKAFQFIYLLKNDSKDFFSRSNSEYKIVETELISSFNGKKQRSVKRFEIIFT